MRTVVPEPKEHTVKLATTFAFTGDPQRTAQQVKDYESAGIDVVITPEIYGFDLVSTLGFLAGQTTTVELMSGIMPLYSRSPALIAQSAAGIDALSQGRFILGLGTSGPQVIEGWHGVPYSKPIGTTRDVIEICKKVWSRERVEHDGRNVTLPLPEGEGTGLGKPLKFMHHPHRQDIPIVVAAIGPANVAMTAEVANGWQPIFFVPDRFRQVWGESLDKGEAKRDADLGQLNIFAGGTVAIGDGPEVNEAREATRMNTGFYVGGMGAKGKNFYNDLFRRYGWEEEAEKIQDLFLSGHKGEAMAAVPDEYLDLATLTGDEGRVRERLQVFKDVGVTHFTINAGGENPLQTIEKVKAWIE